MFLRKIITNSPLAKRRRLYSEDSNESDDTMGMEQQRRKSVRMPIERSITSGSRKLSISFDLSTGVSLSFEDLRQSKSKVVVVGHSSVGKTAFIVRLLTNRFIGHYVQYDFDNYEHKIVLSDGKPHQYDILDLTTVHGTAEHLDEAKFDAQLKWGEIFFLIYSITDRESFKEITRVAFLVSFIHKWSKVKPRLILLGSKLDLYHHREVDHAEGSQLAQTINANFAEFSSHSASTKFLTEMLDVETQSLLADIRRRPSTSACSSPKTARRSISSNDVLSTKGTTYDLRRRRVDSVTKSPT